jgi:hypothetical protein
VAGVGVTCTPGDGGAADRGACTLGKAPGGGALRIMAAGITEPLVVTATATNLGKR